MPRPIITIPTTSQVSSPIEMIDSKLIAFPLPPVNQVNRCSEVLATAVEAFMFGSNAHANSNSIWKTPAVE